jgi:hypothetical protein
LPNSYFSDLVIKGLGPLSNWGVVMAWMQALTLCMQSSRNIKKIKVWPSIKTHWCLNLSPWGTS